MVSIKLDPSRETVSYTPVDVIADLGGEPSEEINMDNGADQGSDDEDLNIQNGDFEVQVQDNVDLISGEPSEDTKLSTLDFVIFAILTVGLFYCYGYILYILSKTKN